ncbi:hypothetical protein LR48_Vigan08g081300 [Vigna angularis]|uniref:Uncharacterized protein n=1 Tax=Phaseolus angularis TaxID=3914 RepID=A0A0L9V4R5_PHAAN|nr:hypothetical protein LR48_Vigan08g081300 [Vigna angularis]
MSECSGVLEYVIDEHESGREVYLLVVGVLNLSYVEVNVLPCPCVAGLHVSQLDCGTTQPYLYGESIHWTIGVTKLVRPNTSSTIDKHRSSKTTRQLDTKKKRSSNAKAGSRWLDLTKQWRGGRIQRSSVSLARGEEKAVTSGPPVVSGVPVVAGVLELVEGGVTVASSECSGGESSGKKRPWVSGELS